MGNRAWWPALASAAMVGGCVGGGRVTAEAPAAAPRPVRSARPATPAAPPARAVGGPIMAAAPLMAAPAIAVPGAETAARAGLLPGPPVAALAITDAQAEAGRVAFLRSCPGLMRRTDGTGMTRGADWAGACAAAAGAGQGRARAFFSDSFEAVQVGDGQSLATGYYEPEIAGSRERGPGYEAPIYGRPSDLVDVDLGSFSTELKGRTIRGKVSGAKLVPFDDRGQIEGGSLAGRAPVLAWAADPVEVFFLQIQGSGRLRLPDGEVMRVGYETQNGREYVGIGSLMRRRGLLQPGQASMQGIVAWLHANPVEGAALMRENRSFVFFRELDGGPVGAMGYEVTGAISAAADPKFAPLGAPVFLSADRTDASGLWVVQDTGGAIKGANRFDTFWGAGAGARLTAGGMSARGTAFVLVPKGTLARLGAIAPPGGGALPVPGSAGSAQGAPPSIPYANPDPRP